ncbi:energy transducer TonB [Sphingomonas sp. RS2018]
MSSQGYQRPKTSPATVIAAIAVNIGIVALIATAGGHFVRVDDDGTIAIRNIPLDDPPPPLPEPTTQPETKVLESTPLPTIPKAEVPIDIVRPDSVAGTDVIPPPGNPPLPGTGGAGSVSVDPIAPPAPVLTDASPDPRAQFQPEYPQSERRAGTEGKVTVRVQIGADGRVIAVEQVSATTPAFFEATRRQALSRWRFRPATRDGVPVDSWRTMSLRFVMEDS